MQRVLVTGAAGFIGSNLAMRCVELGWDVAAVDDMSNGQREFMNYKVSKFYECDFSFYTVLEQIEAKRYDTVFHLAATPRVSYSVEHPIETHKNNVTKTLQLIDVCRGNIKRFVFASSSSVYGGADELPTRESSIKNPKSPYALQKSIIEDYLKLYSELYDLDSACLRFFNVFGPRQIAGGAYATAISSWLDSIKRGKPMRSDGTGMQSRDLCYVDNVVDACIKAATCEDRLGAECFNVACGDRTTNIEILEYMLQRYPHATKIDAPWRSGDVMHTHADVSKANSVFEYVPLVKVWEGIEKTCDWFDANWSWVKDLKQGM